MIDRNEVLALAGKWRVDADEYTKIGCIGLSAIKQDCADELEALAAKAEPQGGEAMGPFIIQTEESHPAPKPAEGEVRKHVGWFSEISPGNYCFLAGTTDPRDWHDNGKPYHHAILAAAPKKGEG